jgi:hypothetical protein
MFHAIGEKVGEANLPVGYRAMRTSLRRCETRNTRSTAA